MDQQGESKQNGRVGGGGVCHRRSAPIHTPLHDSVGGRTDAAMPLLAESKKRSGAVGSCSVDRGLCSPDNLTAFEAELGLAVMPGNANGTEASRKRERADPFVSARRQHPAIESAINNLEHRGMNRVRAHGKEEFGRSAALSLVATNVHHLGLMLRQRETEWRARQRLAA